MECEVTNINNLAPERSLAITVHLGNLVVEVGQIEIFTGNSDMESETIPPLLCPSLCYGAHPSCGDSHLCSGCVLCSAYCGKYL